eukprot:CCRYP_016452-RA/>CCRYP_016452-RA protein AED:0.03 eAED:0.03 QI:234/1/1/1/1/1/2/176/288
MAPSRIPSLSILRTFVLANATWSDCIHQFSPLTRHIPKVLRATTMKDSNEKRWFPLESNPTLLNTYVGNLGFSTDRYSFVDVFSTDSWALDMIPRPVLALVVLFPVTDEIVERRKILHEGRLSLGHEKSCSGVWYVKQRIRNACGTIAILHALANLPSAVQTSEILPSSWLQQYLETCPASTSPDHKASILENDDTIETPHDEATNHCSNQTNRGELNDPIDMHFITFTHVNGKLYELDGRVDNGPICHGCTSKSEFLKDACGVIRELMEADKDELRFTMMALVPSSS